MKTSPLNRPKRKAEKQPASFSYGPDTGGGIRQTSEILMSRTEGDLFNFFANLIIEIVESLSFFGWHAPPLSLLHSPESGM